MRLVKGILQVENTRSFSSAHFLRNLAAVSTVSVLLLGCQTMPETRDDMTSASVGDVLRTAAMTSQGAHNYTAAVKYYQSLYARNPDDKNIVLGYARNLRFVGRANQAIDVLRKGLAKHPEESGLRTELGKAQVAAGRNNEAVGTLAVVTQADPGNWRALSALGIAYDLLGDYRSAQRNYLAALAILPDEPSILNNLALSKALSGDLEGGIAILKRLAMGMNVRPQYRQNLALLYVMQGEIGLAERLIKQDLPDRLAEQNLDYYRELSPTISRNPGAASEDTGASSSRRLALASDSAPTAAGSRTDPTPTGQGATAAPAQAPAAAPDTPATVQHRPADEMTVAGGNGFKAPIDVEEAPENVSEDAPIIMAEAGPDAAPKVSRPIDLAELAPEPLEEIEPIEAPARPAPPPLLEKPLQTTAEAAEPTVSETAVAETADTSGATAKTELPAEPAILDQTEVAVAEPTGTPAVATPAEPIDLAEQSAAPRPEPGTPQPPADAKALAEEPVEPAIVDEIEAHVAVAEPAGRPAATTRADVPVEPASSGSPEAGGDLFETVTALAKSEALDDERAHPDHSPAATSQVRRSARPNPPTHARLAGVTDERRGVAPRVRPALPGWAPRLTGTQPAWAEPTTAHAQDAAVVEPEPDDAGETLAAEEPMEAAPEALAAIDRPRLPVSAAEAAHDTADDTDRTAAPAEMALDIRAGGPPARPPARNVALQASEDATGTGIPGEPAEASSANGSSFPAAAAESGETAVSTPDARPRTRFILPTPMQEFTDTVEPVAEPADADGPSEGQPDPDAKAKVVDDTAEAVDADAAEFTGAAPAPKEFAVAARPAGPPARFMPAPQTDLVSDPTVTPAEASEPAEPEAVDTAELTATAAGSSGADELLATEPGLAKSLAESFVSTVPSSAPKARSVNGSRWDSTEAAAPVAELVARPETADGGDHAVATATPGEAAADGAAESPRAFPGPAPEQDFADMVAALAQQPDPDDPIAAPGDEAATDDTAQTATAAMNGTNRVVAAVIEPDGADIPPAGAPTMTDTDGAPAPAVQASGELYVQIGVFSTQLGAAKWLVEQRDARLDLLSSLRFEIAEVDADDVEAGYNLLAGPVADRGRAADLCDRLKSRQKECTLIVRY
ncbi:MAG: tetratricopeptide repeat protein [Alphaproteobacteria bacterium]